MPTGIYPRKDAEQRFFSHVVELPNGCLQWTGSLNKDGYGLFRLNHKTKQAHRFAWELEHGAIPAGLELDHICRNRGCVNVDHMELVTGAENKARGAHRGHPWEPPEGSLSNIL